ncbi:hypothetical protein G7Y89_g6290 [Cudoniella acicularis]|uniref:Acyltransferase 3 domain-containing protein n=1 Tax=Cudoniella acicularis TaxID=354080 RepID=A0A8H4RP42_9HELO|nr:hypothetical protein G7Y89_g6290 [Cudoniella acicularis]
MDGRWKWSGALYEAAEGGRTMRPHFNHRFESANQVHAKLFTGVSNGESPDIYGLEALVVELVNNLLYLHVLPTSSPIVLQASVLAKIPATAILHHFWIKKQGNVYAWSSMGWLTLGLLLFNLPVEDINGASWWHVPAAGAGMALLSALASVSSQTLIKDASLWEWQIWICGWGTILSALSYPVTSLWTTKIATKDLEVIGPYRTDIELTILTILSAVLGTVVAMILMHKDSLSKSVGSSASLFATAILQFVIFPEESLSQLTVPMVTGGCLIMVATWIYNSYKDQPVTGYRLLDSEPKLVALEESSQGDFEKDVSLEEEQSAGALEDPSQQEFEKNDPLKEELPAVIAPISTMSFIVDAFSCGFLPEPTLKAWASMIIFIPLTLIPSFLNFWSTHPRTAKLYPTSYLDGIRGFAAFFVFINHSVYEWYPKSFRGWDGKGESRLIQFPWVRLIISGHSMVCIFFVVSGFSISYKPLKLLLKGDMKNVLSAAASFTFRRHMRLYLPIVGVSFFMMIAAHNGLYEKGNGSDVPIYPTFFEQTYYWIVALAQYANPFRPIDLGGLVRDALAYDRNLWTIPVEFRGSVAVFLVLILLSQFTLKRRLILMGLIICYCLSTGFWDVFLFLAGVFVAELHFLRGQATQLNPDKDLTKSLFSSTDIGINIFWFLNFVFATFLLSMPGSPIYGGFHYDTLWSWTPSEYYLGPHQGKFWPSIGAVYFVLTIDNAAFLQTLFTNRLALYLGRISFSLYIVHGTILRTLGRHVVWRTLNWAGRDTLFHYALGVAVGFAVVLGVTIWAADLATRLFDERAVMMAKWFYDWLLETEKDAGRGSLLHEVRQPEPKREVLGRWSYRCEHDDAGSLSTATLELSEKRASAQNTSLDPKHNSEATQEELLPTSRMSGAAPEPRPSVADILAHPTYPDTIWDLTPTQKGQLAVAAGRGGPFNIDWEVHGHGDIKLVWIMGLGTNKALLIPERICSLNLISTAAQIENTTTWLENVRTRVNMFIPKSLDRSITDAAHMLFSDAWLSRPDDTIVPTASTPLVKLPPHGHYRMYSTNYERFAAQELNKRLNRETFPTKGFLLQAIAAGWHYKSAEDLKLLADKVGRGRISVVHGTKDNMISVPHGRKLIEMLEPGTAEIKEGAGHVFMLEEWKWHNELVVKMAEKGLALNAEEAKNA